MNKSKLAFGALIGAAAGIVAGLLTAPKSGKETRMNLNAKAKEIKSEAENKAAVLQEHVEEAVAKGEALIKEKLKSKKD